MANDEVIAAQPGTEFSLDVPPAAPGDKSTAGMGPWQLAWRRLRRDKVALAFGGLFLLLVALCIAAPVLGRARRPHRPTTPNHLTDTIEKDGETVNVVGLDGVPIGPTWQGEFFLGADGHGRDNMVRLLYGGRNSLIIGIIAALVTTLFGVLLGLLSGFFRGWTDAILSRLMDIIWAFPVILLGIALGTALALGGLDFGDFSFGSSRSRSRAAASRSRSWSSRSSTSPTSRARCAARCCRCARRSSSRRPAPREWVERGSC